MAIKPRKASGGASRAAKKTATKSARKSQPGQDKLHTKQVQELVNLMVANDLTAVEITNGQLSVSLRRGGGAVPADHAVAPPIGAPAPAAAPPAEIPEAEPVEDLQEIRSPMVGTFYAAPSPDSDPYVSRGDQISPDTVICIVEAMKVMNEIRAECSGVIEEIAVENGQPVEYGQTLFRVRP